MPPVIVWRRIEELHSDAKGSRSCSRKEIGQAAKSIAAFGFNVPILVGQGSRIIAGYVRLLAARQLGWSEVPTILLDHLTPAQANAFTTADDRLAETGSWNDLLLAMQLKELSPIAEPDSGDPCRHPSRRRHTTRRTPAPAELRPGAAAIADETEEQPASLPLAEVPVDGDVWLLGNHRVHCGNDSDAVAEMLTEEGAVVVFAPDPAVAGAIIRR